MACSSGLHHDLATLIHDRPCSSSTVFFGALSLCWEGIGRNRQPAEYINRAPPQQQRWHFLNACVAGGSHGPIILLTDQGLHNPQTPDTEAECKSAPQICGWEMRALETSRVRLLNHAWSNYLIAQPTCWAWNTRQASRQLIRSPRPDASPRPSIEPLSAGRTRRHHRHSSTPATA